MQETIYLKVDQNSFMTKQIVRLEDVASVYCSNAKLQDAVKHLELVHFEKNKKQVVVISVMEIIRNVTREYPNANICNLGETDFIIEYGNAPKKNWWSLVKVLLTCSVVFVGSAFTIMAYNNDIGILELFDYCYQLITGSGSTGLLEAAYSLGLAVGIIVFYNHFAGKKLSDTPTPVEVQMRSYESDVNTAIIERAARTHLEMDGGK